MRRMLIGFALVLFASAPALAEGPAAKVSDLAWMTGHYKGNTGTGTLEERWAIPEAGSIAALVRSTADGATNMIYSRSGNDFTISIKTAGGAFDIPLTSQSPH